MKNKQGFTLIELLIVIGIIAILASGVIVAINPGQQFEQARNSTRWQHMNTIANAVYSYAVENNGNLPTCDDIAAANTLYNGGSGGAARDVAECASEITPTYVNELPLDPSEGVDQSDTGYEISSSDGTTITLTSTAQEAIDAGVTMTK
jgi:prepilin-type N-terminal cleavage/methylation domain-containing protein